MKKLAILILFTICISFLQSCGPSAKEVYEATIAKSTGPYVLRLNNAGNILGYNWSIVDTTGGFTTISTGIWSTNVSDSYYGSQGETKQIETLLKEFQKKFKVQVINYYPLVYGEIQTGTSVYLRIFFQPVIDIEHQKLIKAYSELNSKNDNLQLMVEDLKKSNRKILKELKKLEDKK